MSDDPVAAYRKAIKARNEAGAQLSKFSGMFRTVVKKLTNFGEPLYIRGAPKSLDVKIDVALWPTGQQIVDAIDAWHRAHADATTAWSQIPEDERDALKAPDHF